MGSLHKLYCELIDFEGLEIEPTYVRCSKVVFATIGDPEAIQTRNLLIWSQPVTHHVMLHMA